MSRYRQRICLEAGLKLELYELMRRGCMVPGTWSAFNMCWTNNYSGQEAASANFTCHMFDKHEGRLCIVMDDMEQTIILTPRRRKFGGHQWYFMCPFEQRCCSVLWRPSGANEFRCRQGWGHRGKAKIKARLIAELDPDEWELPPKPMWMRWRTYNRYEERFDEYEAILNDGIADLMVALLGIEEKT